MTGLFFAWQIAATMLGAALGSFVALATYRVPADIPLWSPPSRCPVCHAPIHWTDNIPILSWLALRARCRACDAPISPAYPLIELTTALIGWLMFHRFVPSPSAIDLPHLVAFGTYLLFATLALTTAFTDQRAYLIPEFASHWAVPVGLLLCSALPAIGYEGWLSLGWTRSVLGVLVTGGGMAAVYYGAILITGQEGMAWGDVRFAALMGAFLGPYPGALFALMVAGLTGSTIAIATTLWLGRPRALPFGPWMALGSLVYVLYGDHLIRWFLPRMAPAL